MDLLKISIGKDALIERTALYRDILGTAPLLAQYMPEVRNTTDSIRAALTYQCRVWKRQEPSGAECRIVRKAGKGAKGLNLRLRVEHLPDDAEQEIASITGGSNGRPVVIDMTYEGKSQFPEWYEVLKDTQTLTEFGQEHCFEGDLRRLCEEALASACVPLWPGLALVVTPEARAMVDTLSGLLGTLKAGSVTLRCLSLDNTPANREALARELREGIQEQLAKLFERTTYTAPNMPAIQREYDALAARITLTEEVLGVELGCLEAQVGLEMALDV